MEKEEMRVQADSGLAQFIKNFALKHKPLFRKGLFSYHVPPSESPSAIDFPYEAYTEIRTGQE
jgi:hypothetical protein